jgi:hypothetical protein
LEKERKMRRFSRMAIVLLILVWSATLITFAHGTGEDPLNPIQIPFTGGQYSGNFPWTDSSNQTHYECWYNFTCLADHWINATLYTSNGTDFTMQLYGPSYRNNPGNVGNFTFLADWAGNWSLRVIMDNSVSGNYTLAMTPLKLLGDVNNDYKVDGKDLGSAAATFASYGPNYLYPGSAPSPRWNLYADINGDNKIDGKDLGIIALNFGK